MLQEQLFIKALEQSGMDPDIAKLAGKHYNNQIKEKKAKKEEKTNAIESTAQTALAVTGAVLSGGAGAAGMGNLIAELSVQGANIALSTAIGSRKGGAQGAAAGLLNGLVSSVAPFEFNKLPVALNISFDKKDGWGGGIAIGGNKGNASLNVSQRGGAKIEVGSTIGSLNYNTANGTYGANLNVTGLLNAGKEPLLPAEFTQGLFKNIGANIGWNSRTGASASISYNFNNSDTNKPIAGFGINIDRQGSHFTGSTEGTNLFTSSSDGSFQINTNFANERLTNNTINAAQDAFDEEMNRRETVAADTALRDAKPPLPPPYNVDLDPSEMTPELREKALKLLGNRMGKDNKAAETSRTSYLDHLVGGVTDGFQNLGTALGLNRNQVSGTTGFVDEYGNFHPRTCFTKGTKIHKLKDSIAKEKDMSQFR